MSDRMPENIWNKMPKNISNRMSENLPIIKYINVMVGITRNKLI
jgi:hypothetical protein